MMNLGAQIYPNALSVDSVHPDTDSLVFNQIRARMDSVRRNCGRPAVALVLSGGGAKGAAEVGVLKYIEELGIPIDFICGTSIGGLIGGLYSIGYRSDDIKELFVTRNWWSETLTDRIDARYFTYDKKQYKSKFALSIPFHFRREDYLARKRADVAAGDYDGRLNVGADAGTITSSLPSGYAYGFHVNNLLSSLTVGYQDSLSFASLPIPFVCVAADVVSYKAHNFGSGQLKTAMRSTMSIPGLFNPVRNNGMVLVDGGVRNNLPVDIAHAIGADYVVAVDLSDIDPTFSQVNNVGSVFLQFFSMLGADSFNRNRDLPATFVKPDVTGYNMLSFNAEAIDTMYARGYFAASESDGVRQVREALPDSVRYSTRPSRMVDIRNCRVNLASVEFIGVSDDESSYLHSKIGKIIGNVVSASEIDEAMSIIQATGCFQTVTYSLLGETAPYRLVFECVRGPVHQIGLGVRVDTEDWVSAIFNLGLNTHRLMGSKLDATVKLGVSQSLEARYFLDLPKIPTLNAEFDIAHYSGSIVNDLFDDTSIGRVLHNDAGYWTHSEKLYLSNLQWKFVNVNLGLRNRYFSMMDDTLFAYLLKQQGYTDLSGNYFGAFLRADRYTFDDKYYPSHGMKLGFRYDVDFAKGGGGGFVPIHAFQLGVTGVVPLGAHVSFIPDFNYRGIINFNGSSCFAHLNYAGGMIQSRYLEQHFQYFGCNKTFVADDHLAILTLALRGKVARNVYVSALGGYLRDAPTFNDLIGSVKPSDFSFGVEGAFNSIVGPIRLNIHWSNAFKWGAYFSMGFDF